MSRLIYWRNPKERHAIRAKWDQLRIKKAPSLVQQIQIQTPEFSIDETQLRKTHFVDSDNPTIYIAEDTEPSLATSFISQHLATYFLSPPLAGDIALILNTSPRSLGQLLTDLLNIPSLPEDWRTNFSLNTSQTQDVDIPEPGTPGDSEHPDVGIPLEEVAHIGSIVEAAIQHHDGQIHSRIDEFQTSRMETGDSNIADIIAKNLNPSPIGASGSPGRHRSTSAISEGRIQSGSSKFEEDDLQKRIRNRTIGFGGELFVRLSFECH
jgi:hypothetical protein